MGLLKAIARRVERKVRQKEGEGYTNIVAEAREYNAALNAMGLTSETDEGQKMRYIGMFEITSKKFPFLKNYKRDLFLQGATDEAKQIIVEKSKK